MAQLVVYPIDRIGTSDLTTILVAAAVGGDSFAITGQEFLVISNGSGSPITVTMAITQTVDGEAVTNRTYVVAAGHVVVLGGFNPSIYADTNGLLQLTYSGVTTLKVAIIQYTGQ